MKKRFFALIVCLCLFTSLVGCGNTPGGDTGDVTIAYSSAASSALAIWSGYLETNLRAECEERGWNINALSAEGDAELQGEQVTQLINMDPDVFVLFPTDPQMAGDWVKEIHDADIPCIMIAQDVPEDAQEYVTAYVGFDQYEMCYKIAETMIEKNGADAGLNIVCVSGVPVQQDYIDREAGFNAAISELTNYNVLATEYAFSSRSDAKGIMENYISTYGDSIDAVVCYEDDLMMGALQAIDEAGLTGEVQVYGVAPAMTEAMQAIQDGRVETDVLMRTCDMMEICAEQIERILAGEEVEYYQESPLYYLTADNVEEYLDMAEY